MRLHVDRSNFAWALADSEYPRLLLPMRTTEMVAGGSWGQLDVPPATSQEQKVFAPQPRRRRLRQLPPDDANEVAPARLTSSEDRLPPALPARNRSSGTPESAVTTSRCERLDRFATSMDAFSMRMV